MHLALIYRLSNVGNAAPAAWRRYRPVNYDRKVQKWGAFWGKTGKLTEDFSLTAEKSSAIICNRIVTFSNTLSRKGMDLNEKDISRGAAADVYLPMSDFGCFDGAACICSVLGGEPKPPYICVQGLSCPQ